ncbi:MAG: hypothetical protein M3011_10770 [Actinomycetota bacterium]|nr:hypothetical protein [Actinomycetota bacterium]
MSDETNETNQGPDPVTDPKFSDRSRVTGISAPDSNRAGEGEGVRAPLAQDGADHSEFSVFDGQGRESVVVVGTNDEGKVTQATGESSEEAQGLLGKMKDRLGEGFGPPKGH